MRFTCKTIAMISLLGLAVFWVGSAHASGSVEAREHRQRARIAAGIANGSVTHGEAHRLYRQQAKIERTQQRLRSDDGRLGPHERLRLDLLQDRSAIRIRKARHNDRTQ